MSRELSSSRFLDATPENVFKAIENPEILALWWGPEGFSNDFHEFAFLEGADWKFAMIGPDGTSYPNHCVFEKISPERIVIRHLGSVHAFTLVIGIKPENEGTRITWNMTFDSAEECKKAMAYAPACNEQLFDRLAIELTVMAPSERDLVLRRIIDAPAEKVFQAWTDPEMIVKWFTPPPYKTTSADLDPRPGGRFFVMMQGPKGEELPNPGVYLEVVKNKRIVSSDAYTAAWKPSAKPFSTLDLNFEDLGGKTKYTAIVRHWTVADKKAHEDMGFHTGWGIAASQLENLIKTQL